MEKKIFYICSYGGSGSSVLFRSLEKYGDAYHIHSRYPPDKLEYAERLRSHLGKSSWFNGKKIPQNELSNYYVIYIYRNPVKSIKSIFHKPQHLKNIQTNPKIKVSDVVSQNKDLFGINEFHNNYTKKNQNRNYKIYSVKYEDLFESQDLLSKFLGIGPLNLEKRERKRVIDNDVELKLNKVYKDIIEEMNKNNTIEII